MVQNQVMHHETSDELLHQVVWNADLYRPLLVWKGAFFAGAERAC